MRHRNKGRKLGRNSAHRKALARNILRSLFEHGTIITTLAKAKEYAPKADKLITIAKRAEVKAKELEVKLENREDANVAQQCDGVRAFYFKRALTILGDKKLVQKLFYDIAPLYTARAGGYTQVLRLDKTRIGDSAPTAVLKLVVEMPEKSERVKTSEELEKEKERLKKERDEKKQREKERKAKAKEKEKELKAKIKEKQKQKDKK